MSRSPGGPSPRSRLRLDREDAFYVASVGVAGLQLAGADPLGAALFTAAHLLLLGLATTDNNRSREACE